MTNHDAARWEAGKRVDGFNQSHPTELTAIPDYHFESDELVTLLQQVEIAAAMQQQDNTGKVTNKAALRTAMADTLVIYTKRAIVKAHRLGNAELEAALDHGVTYYTTGNTAQAIARAIAVKDLLKANLAILTNVSAADITTIEAAITAFSEAADAPLTARQSKKLQGTDQLETALDRMDVVIENMGNLIDSYRPDLSAEFDLRSRLIELGVRSNSVTLTIQDATTGDPIPGATATNESGSKSAISTTGGIAVFESVRSGTQNFIVVATGYATATVSIKVMRGKNTEGVVKLGRG